MFVELPHSAIECLFESQHPACVARYFERPLSTSYLLTGEQSRGGMRYELSAAEAKIAEIASLPEGWDGYGAIRIGKETLQNAKNAINELHSFAPSPDITPNTNGTISLEWESDEGYGHLEIGRTKFSFYIKPVAGQPIFADGDADNIGANIGLWVSKMLFPVQYGAETITKISFTGNVLQSAF